MACKTFQRELMVETRGRFDVVDITSKVREIVMSAGINTGILHVYVPHTTCGITINEAETGLINDIITFIKEYTKPDAPWQHNRIDDNAHAHLGQSLLGHHASIPIGSGRPLLGTWQRILLVEMDGPRRRRVIVTVLGE